MTTTQDLLARIQSYCRDHGVAETTFGRLAVNDGKLVSRLRAGGSVTLATVERIERVLSATTEAAA